VTTEQDQPTELRGHQQEWETLARLDPLWAILTSPEGKGNRWDVDRFFRTGADQVARVMRKADALGLPRARASLLDFGCGVGRLTRAFAPFFAECVGVDISPTMVRKAQEFNAGVGPCRFEVNDAADLRLFPDGRFDMVYTEIVLQHLPGRAAIEGYVAEFVRVLRPGGLLVFQLPSHIPWPYRFRLRRRLYLLLRGLGFSDDFLHHRLHLTTIRMQFVPVEQMRAFLAGRQARVLDVERGRDGPVESATYYATREAAPGPGGAPAAEEGP
jgi:SAM-dependent methyltransferase